MNVSAIQKKFEEYYSNATPEQVLKEFEALGVEFATVPEVQEIEFACGLEFPFEFNDDLRSWLENLSVNLLDSGTSGYIPVSPEKIASTPNYKDAASQTEDNYQYAMAA